MQNHISKLIGMHARLQTGLLDVVTKVEELNLPVVQSFFLLESKSYTSLSNRTMSEFRDAKKRLNFLYFLHSAYWSNLVDMQSRGFLTLLQEIRYGLEINMDGIVIHAGATKFGLTEQERIAVVAESVNTLLHYHPTAKILLENSAHGNRNFGGNIEDLAALIDHIEKKEQLAFCIDTAHAHVYGYDLKDEKSQEEFILLLDNLLGIDRIALLHLNDCEHAYGSRIDQHALPGHGTIGQEALKRFIGHEKLRHIPMVLEAHKLSTEEEKAILKEISLW